MRKANRLLVLWLALLASQAFAWGDHRFPSYRAFCRMPEVASGASAAQLQRAEASIAELLGNLGADSRNAVLGILRASSLHCVG
jgi:hypothetical protein